MDRQSLKTALETRWMGRELEWWPRIDSTNLRMKQWIREGAGPGAAVVAEMQSAGRGRHEKVWWSPAGSGLYCSFGLAPPKETQGLLGLLAGIAVCAAARRLTGLAAGIKWPNDAMLGGKKFGGILVENGPGGRAVVGIGINVRGAISSPFAHATVLEVPNGARISRSRLFAVLAEELEAGYERWLSDGARPIVERWREASVTLGQWVDVIPVRGEPWGGRAVDIDPAGALMVEDDRGRVRYVWAGEVSLRFQGGRYAPD